MAEVVALYHVTFEDLGLIEGVLKKRGHAARYSSAPVMEAGDLAALDPDLLVVLGGPIGVYEEDVYPFLKTEIALIERRLAAGKPTLGVCLGAQLMARALGSRVYPGPAKEIGWSPLTLTEAGRASPLRHLDGAKTHVLHWHGDTFDLPSGATRLASTPICQNQAFSYGAKALGLQFHGEAYGRALESWFVGHAVEIAAAKGVTVAGLRADTQRWSKTLAEQGALSFDEWLAQAGL
jgi:GMP synthase (glutamine-hydrolysing)